MILGEPTGGTIKAFFGNRLAFQSSLGFSFWEGSYAIICADLIWYPMLITENRHFMLTWYFGGGVGFGIRTPWYSNKHDGWEADPSVLVRAPSGVSFLFERVPVEAFVEVGISVKVYRPWYIRPIIAVGGRWYF